VTTPNPSPPGGSRDAWSEPRPVDVAAIERELGALLGSPAPGESALPTRARMSNLVVFASRDAADGGELPESIAEISGRHPSRVLLLVDDPDLGAEPRAWVSALCRLGGGGRRVCSEQVSIRSGPDGLRRLPSIVRPLLVGDLPTALWWAVPTAPPLAGELFRDLSGMARRVLWDSRDWDDEAGGLRSTARWAGGADPRQGLADLAWVRLAPWRAAIGRALGTTAASTNSLRIVHGPHALPEALLLVGWLADRLGWRRASRGDVSRVSARWRLAGPGGDVSVDVLRVPDGPSSVIEATFEQAVRGARVSVVRDSDERLRVEPPLPGGGILPGTSATPAEIVARELSDLDGDPMFRPALAVARSLAEDVAG